MRSAKMNTTYKWLCKVFIRMFLDALCIRILSLSISQNHLQSDLDCWHVKSAAQIVSSNSGDTAIPRLAFYRRVKEALY